MQRYSSEAITATTHGATLRTIVDHVEAGRYQTDIETVVGFDQLREAHAGMDANLHAGKVVATLA